MPAFRIIKTLLWITAIAWSTSLSAQEPPSAEVALLGRSYGDHITLRYFATTPALFNTANQLGYVIEKAVWNAQTPVSRLHYVPLKGSPFTRWPETKWEAEVKKLSPADSNELKLAALAMGLSDPTHSGSKQDVLENDLESLKAQQEAADNRFAYMLIATSRSRLAAEGLALRISDFDVQKGRRYVYRVRINDDRKGVSATWAYIDIECREFGGVLTTPDSAVVVKEDDRMVSFSFPESKEYFAFSVERSDDEGRNFHRLTDMPSFKLKPRGYDRPTDYGFSDSGLVNYKKYLYRIWVSTPFADEVLLSQFNAIPRDRTPPPSPFLRSAEHTAPNLVELTWELPQTGTKDLKGFMVRRSSEEKGEYRRISANLLDPSARTYRDDSFVGDGLNYYVIEAIDTAGNMSRSFPAYVTLIDSTPPAIPKVETAFIDSLGKVIIRIQPNTERDFMGYQLLKANAADHEFSVVEETYRDSSGRSRFVLYDSTTLKTLTRSVYYQLIAFDTHFNQSAPSRIVELVRRDTIPPVSPLITDYLVTDSCVAIEFVNSASEDVSGNILLRRATGDTDFDSIYINKDTGITRFADYLIAPGKQYDYAMVAVDLTGLRSKMSNTVSLKTLPAKRLPPPVITLVTDKERLTVQIDVVQAAGLNPDNLKAEIFRRTAENEWVLIKTIELARGNSFTDTVTKGAPALVYAARLMDTKGVYSIFSKEVRVDF